MLFAHKYPDMPHLAYVEEQGDTIVFFANGLYPCGQCQLLTSWYSISFHYHVCSEECLQSLWGSFVHECVLTAH